MAEAQAIEPQGTGVSSGKGPSLRASANSSAAHLILHVFGLVSFWAIFQFLWWVVVTIGYVCQSLTGLWASLQANVRSEATRAAARAIRSFLLVMLIVYSPIIATFVLAYLFGR